MQISIFPLKTARCFCPCSTSKNVPTPKPGERNNKKRGRAIGEKKTLLSIQEKKFEDERKR